MKTSKTHSLSWQNKLISTALASVSLILGAPQLAVASLPNTTSTNMTSGFSNGTVTASTSLGSGAMTITTTATNAVINWGNFSDGTAPGGLLNSADTITFAGSSAVLNNITGGIPTVLGGNLNSTGKLFFLNPAGIIVGGSTIVNAAAFYASTVSDISAANYFVTYGTLGVFNGVTPLSTSQSSTQGIIYVQSGAQINALGAGQGTVGLASSYAGSGVAVYGNTSAVITPTTYAGGAASYTVNTGSAGAASVKGVSIDNLNVNGNLSVYTMGGAVVTGNAGINTAGIVTSNSGYFLGVTATGGNFTVVTNGGAFTNNAASTVQGSSSISTYNSSGYGSAGATGSAVTFGGGTFNTLGNLTITTANSGGTGGGITETTGVTSVANGNVTVTGTTALVAGLTGSAAINLPNATLLGTVGTSSTPVQGTGVTITQSGASTLGLTIANINSNGTVNITAPGNLTLTTVNAYGTSGTITATSQFGSVALGNTTTQSVATGTGLNLITGNAGNTSVTNALFSAGGTTLTVVTNNTSSLDNSGNGGNITIANTTVNGNLNAQAGIGAMTVPAASPSAKGTVTLTGLINVGTTANVNTGSGYAGNLVVTTSNGAINIGTSTSSATVTVNGTASFTTNSIGGTYGPRVVNAITMPSNSSSITLTNILAGGNLPGTAAASFTTNNGAITLFNVSVASGNSNSGGLNIQELSAGAVSLTNTATTGNVMGNVYITANNGAITVSGVTVQDAAPNSGGSYNNTFLTGNQYSVSLTSNTINSNVSWTSGGGDANFTINTGGQGLAYYGTAGTYAPSSGVTTVPTISASGAASNGATTSITLSVSGNVGVTNNIVAPIVSLTATNGYLYTQNIDSTVNAKTSVTLSAGQGELSNLSTSTASPTSSVIYNNGIGNTVAPATLSLTATTGNVGLYGNISRGLATVSQNNQTITLSSGSIGLGGFTPNVNIDSSVLTSSALGAGAGIPTLNGLTVTGNGLFKAASVTLNASGTTGLNLTVNSAIISGNTASLSLGSGSGLGGISYTNLGIGSLTVTGSDNGSLTLNTSGITNLGSSSSKTLSVTGNLIVNASGGDSTSTQNVAPVNANYGNFSNVSITTNNSQVTLGLGSASDTITGSVNVTTNYYLAGTGYPVSIVTGTGGVNLATVSTNSLAVSTTGNITNTAGIITAPSASFSTGTSTAPGSLSLGSATIAAGTVTQASNINVTATGTTAITANGQVLTAVNIAGPITYNQTGGSIATLNAGGSSAQAVNITSATIGQENVSGTAGVTSTITSTPVTTLNIVGPATSTLTGSPLTNLTSNSSSLVTTTLNSSPTTTINQISTASAVGDQIVTSVINSTVGTVTMLATGGGKLTYNTQSSPTTSGSFQVGTGGLTVNASGTSGLGAYTYNLNNYTSSSLIQAPGSFTLSNVTSNSIATGSLTVSANAQPGSGSSVYTAPNGGVVNLGSGIALSQNTGSVTFTSGNSSLGGVNDTGTSGVFIYGAATSITGKTISISSGSNNFPTVSLTSNGTINYTEAGSIVLGGLALGTAATSATLTSTGGAISQTGAITSSNTADLSFTASGVYATTGVAGTITLNSVDNRINNNTNAGAAGGKGGIYLNATGNTALYNTSYDVNLIGVNISNTGNNATLYIAANTTGNINQKSGSVFSWGNATFVANSTTAGNGNISLSGAGNNFGVLTVQAGNNKTGNASITEVASSVYNLLQANQATIVSGGDIYQSTTNQGISLAGTSSFKAQSGLVNLGTGVANNFGNNAITLISGSNATILDTNSTGTKIASGSTIGGNLIVTNNQSGALLSDTAGTSGISVIGSTSLNATSGGGGNITFTNYNNVFNGGIYFKSTTAASIYALGNLSILPGSTTGTGYLSASGNISNVGNAAASVFTTLNLVTSLGNVTLSYPVVIGTLIIYAPAGIVDLSNLSLRDALNNNAPIISPTPLKYYPPNP
jgi:hypothetical protein